MCTCAQVLKKLTSKSGAFAFWSLFFAAPLLEVMTKNSNQYATSLGAGGDYYPEFKAFKQVEIEQCFGLLYRNGLSPVPNIDLMFADPRTRWAFGDARIRDLLGPASIIRFKQFRALFHIQHPSDNRYVMYNADSDKFVHSANPGPFAKLEPMLGYLRHGFMTHWIVGETFSMDEITVGFMGRHPLAKRITYKREGDGFLFDALCDDGYLWCFCPRHIPITPPPEPKASALHNRCLFMLGLLTKFGCGAKWRRVYFDNLFTSYAFAIWAAIRMVRERTVAVGGEGLGSVRGRGRGRDLDVFTRLHLPGGPHPPDPRVPAPPPDVGRVGKCQGCGPSGSGADACALLCGSISHVACAARAGAACLTTCSRRR